MHTDRYMSSDDENAVHTALVPTDATATAAAAAALLPTSGEARRSLEELEADDPEYRETHTHPRPGHDHEKPPKSGIFSFLYAVEGGDPDGEVDVVHELEDEVGEMGPGGHRVGAPCFSFRTLMSYTGPGFLMCIAYLDPGNLEADLQVGAYTGYDLLWMLALATFMGFALQCMAARLGVVTGKNLARVCKEHYSHAISMVLWVLIELAIIGNDLQEIIGSAIAFQILFGFPLWLGCLVTFIDTFTFLAIHYFGIRKLEGLFVVLVAIMTVCFFINFGKQPPPPGLIAEGFVPQIKPFAVLSAVGLIGAVIMPHNIYLHSALVLSRKVNRRKPAHVIQANKYFAIDSGIALLVSFVINLAVVSVFAYHFFDDGCANIVGGPLACLSRDAEGACICSTIGLAGAHDALADALGKSAKYIWGVGLLAAGQASTMTGTYAGQYVMEGFLDLKIPLWARVTFTRFVAIGPGLVVAILTENNQNLSDMFQEAINVFNSVLLSFALLPVLHFTSSSAIMGEHVSGLPLTVTIWSLAFMVLAINIYLVVLRIGGGQPWWMYVLTAIGGIIYLRFSYALVADDVVKGYWGVVEMMPEGWEVRRRLLERRKAREVEGGKEGGGKGVIIVASGHHRLDNPLIESVSDGEGEAST